MKNQKTWDSLGRCNADHDMYSVHSAANRRPSSRPDLFDESKKNLESQIYVRLQGHDGIFLSLLGRFCRLVTMLLLFPYYGCVVVINKLKSVCSRALAGLKRLLAPHYARICRWLAALERLRVRVCDRIAKVFQFFASKWNKMQRMIIDRIIKIYKKLVHPPLVRIQLLFKKIYHKANSWGTAFQKIFSRKMEKFGGFRIVNKVKWDQCKEIVQKGMRVVKRTPNESVNSQWSKPASFAKRHWRSIRTWVKVLSRYGFRVLEDWALEVKQWFSLS